MATPKGIFIQYILNSCQISNRNKKVPIPGNVFCLTLVDEVDEALRDEHLGNWSCYFKGREFLVVINEDNDF
jgi:hypothetical protein